ncbi:hypothetical protein [Microvirga splendida]|uniref:Uncharacterized protein n=1 Tax=Microvirga splendida TaxID=2795727 RepID=A0ABS0Y4S1_9HYPH|nr:hypothetical protein [Microvirga splendida]MBJ6127299.1 hypothetical protein [Microvirga splendida]
MAAEKQDIVQGLLADTEKALRRSKKLEKTLLKVVAQSETGSAAEGFLKSVQQGMKALKRDAKQLERSLNPASKKAPRRKAPALKSADAETPARKKAPAKASKASGKKAPEA